MASNALKDKTKRLTTKQEAFVRHLVENPKDSATEAAAQVYDVANRDTARSIAAENLAKPSIISELSKYNNLMENTLVNTVNDFKDSLKISERALAIDIAKYVHDKVHGKAVQKVQTDSRSISITIDLTQSQEPTE